MNTAPSLTTSFVTPFEAMGIPSGGDHASWAATVRLLRAQIADGDWVPVPGGGLIGTWLDASGAGADIRVDARTGARDGAATAVAAACLSPQFTGGSVQVVTVAGAFPDATCRDCDLVSLEVHGEGPRPSFPLLVSTVGIAIDRDRLLALRGRRVRARLTVAAERVVVCGDEDASVAAQPVAVSMTPGHGRRGFPRAAAYGVAAEVEERRNELFGRVFTRLVLGTSGGAFDVVAARTATLDLSLEGRVLRVDGWVCGHVDTQGPDGIAAWERSASYGVPRGARPPRPGLESSRGDRTRRSQGDL